MSENGFANSNSSNSFYASFKIYINRFSGATQNQVQQQQKVVKNQPTNSSKIVRIERIECDAEPEEVFFESQKTQNVEVQIKVDPPPVKTEITPPRFSRENSPVFYLEPDDWPEDKTPPMVTSPTRALSPCGCGKIHTSHTPHMESLPENRRAFSASSFKREISTSPPVRSCSGTHLTLPSPRAAIMSEIMSQHNQQRQRKVTIPVLCARAVNSAVSLDFLPIWRDFESWDYLKKASEAFQKVYIFYYKLIFYSGLSQNRFCVSQ